MRKLTSLIFIFFVISNFLFAQEEEGKPEIKFDKTTHDFGDIIENQNPTHTFKVTNTGSAPLKLTHVKASCGCTTPDWTRDEIKPGEEGIVKATFRSRGYTNKNFHKSITITTNIIDERGQPKKIFLHIKGHVLAKAVKVEQDTTIKISEYFHDFGEIKKGKKQKWSFTITNNGKDTLTIHDIQKSSNFIEVIKKGERIAPGESQIIKVIFNSKEYQGTEFLDKIKIITNIPISKTRKISNEGITIKANFISK